jgi:hypothetical protein
MLNIELKRDVVTLHCCIATPNLYAYMVNTISTNVNSVTVLLLLHDKTCLIGTIIQVVISFSSSEKLESHSMILIRS